MQYMPEKGKMYSTKDVAFMFERGVQTVLTWVWRGLIIPVKIGNRNYYKGEELIALLESGNVRKLKRPIRKRGVCEKRTSICEECLKAFNGCSWSRDGKPIPGWNAKRVNINEYKDKEVYRVNACPEFEEERFYTDEKGIRRRVNEVPEAWKEKKKVALLYGKVSE